jgi:hypothetical protein
MNTDLTNVAEVVELARGATESLDADLAEKTDAEMRANIAELHAVVSGQAGIEDFLCRLDDDDLRSILGIALTRITESYAKRLGDRHA